LLWSDISSKIAVTIVCLGVGAHRCPISPAAMTILRDIILLNCWCYYALSAQPRIFCRYRCTLGTIRSNSYSFHEKRFIFVLSSHIVKYLLLRLISRTLVSQLKSPRPQQAHPRRVAHSSSHMSSSAPPTKQPKEIHMRTANKYRLTTSAQ